MLTQTLISVSISALITAIMLWLYEMGRKRWRQESIVSEVDRHIASWLMNEKSEVTVPTKSNRKPRVHRNREDLVVEREREKERDGEL